MVTKYNTGQCCTAHLPVTIVSAEQHGGKIEYNVQVAGKLLKQTVPEELIDPLAESDQNQVTMDQLTAEEE